MSHTLGLDDEVAALNWVAQRARDVWESAIERPALIRGTRLNGYTVPIPRMEALRDALNELDRLRGST